MPRPLFSGPSSSIDAPTGPAITRSFITRRDFLKRTSVAAGALATVPVVGLPSAAAAVPGPRAWGDGLDRFIHRKMREACLPSLAAAAVCGQNVRSSIGYGWADREADVRACHGHGHDLKYSAS